MKDGSIRYLGGPDTGATETWGQYLTEGAKTVARHIPMQAANLGPMGAGAAMGTALGGPIGGLVGAGIGGFATPAIEHATGGAVGVPTQDPTYGQAGQSAAAAMEAEMGAPALEKYVGEPLMQFGGKLWREVTGASEIGEAATEAGAKTEAANMSERARLQQAATTEAAQQKEASLKAASTAGEGQFRDISGRRGQIVSAQQRAQQTASSAQIEADTVVSRARDRLTKEAEPAARQEVLEGTLHPAGGQPMGAGPERIQRSEQFRDSDRLPTAAIPCGLACAPGRRHW